MSSTVTQLAQAATQLREAYQSGPVAPLREALDAADVASAYAIQTINTEWWVQQGRRIVGKKIGLTALAVQRQLGVDQPDFGVLFDDMLITDGGELRADKVLQAKVEGEVAFVIAKDLDNPRANLVDMMSSVAYALPAIEVVDSRIRDWKISIADTVADNASSSHFLLGSEPRSLTGLDLSTCGMVMSINGATASIGVGAACLGHPLMAAVWLARTLAKRGQPLREGDIIMSGALGPMASLTVDSRVSVKIGGIGSTDFFFRGVHHEN